MNCKYICPEFELGSLIPFPTTVIVTLSVPWFYEYVKRWGKKKIVWNDLKVILWSVHAQRTRCCLITEVKQTFSLFSTQMGDHSGTVGTISNLMPVCQTKQSLLYNKYSGIRFKKHAKPKHRSKGHLKWRPGKHATGAGVGWPKLFLLLPKLSRNLV